MRVLLLDGGAATVVALHMLPGIGLIWDLSLDAATAAAVAFFVICFTLLPAGLPSSQAVWHNAREKVNRTSDVMEVVNAIDQVYAQQLPSARFPSSNQKLHRRDSLVKPYTG